jgi:hypothetical protein
MSLAFDNTGTCGLDAAEVFTDCLAGTPATRRRLATYLWTPPIWPALMALVISMPILVTGLCIALVEIWLHRAMLGGEVEILPTLASRIWPGIFGCAIALAVWYLPRGHRRRSGMADEDFDRQLQADVNAVIERGRRTLGLRYPQAGLGASDDDQTIVREPLVLTRGVWPSDFENHAGLSHVDVELACVVTGDDGGRRFGIYEIDVVYMAQHHLSVYVAYLDLRAGSLLAEDAHEAHYKDINSLHVHERQHRDIPWPAAWLKVRALMGATGWPGLLARLVDTMLRRALRRQMFVTRAFDVHLGSGTCLKVPFHSTRLKDARTPGSSLTAENVTTLRELLREKRKGYVRLLSEDLPLSDGLRSGLTLVEPRM